MSISRRFASGILLASPMLLRSADAWAQTDIPDVRAVLPLVHETYRYLHQHPELGKEEHRAHAHISRALRRLPRFELQPVHSLPTAIIAVFDSGRPGRCRGLRAELDARPIAGQVEPEDHNPRSTIAGRMHTCGHDAHAAMLLGAAAYVAANPGEFDGRIVFIFQPAEEIEGGADDIVASGVLSRLGVEALFAQHAAPGLPVGTIALSRGTSLAGSNTFTLVLRGRGSHAAVPYEGDDIAVLAARFIEDLATYPARHLDIANRPIVISPSNVSVSSGAANVLPSEARITGTIRAFEPWDQADSNSVGARLHNHLQRLAQAYGIELEWSVRAGSPPTTNDELLFDASVAALRPRWGDSLDISSHRGMFAEDFSYYTRTIRSLYFGLGIQRGGLGAGAIHTRDFTIHPDALEYGVRLHIQLARDVALPPSRST